MASERKTQSITGAELHLGDVVPTSDWGDVIVDCMRQIGPLTDGTIWLQWYGVGEGATRKFVVAPLQKMDDEIIILVRQR